MAFLTATTPITSMDGEHRFHFAQVNDVVVCTNGHNNNQCYYTRTGTGSDLGIATPGAAPTHSVGGAGNVTGAVRYRVRWLDAVRGTTISMPSAELSVTGLTGSIITITRPGSPPSRATHWIVERTLDSGKVFYPVNRDTTLPSGTVIATTTYADNVLDATLRQRYSIGIVQRTPVPYRHCFSNLGRVFMGGGRVHTVSATMTNASAAVTNGERFNSNMIGQYLSVPADQDGKMYEVTAVGGLGALTISPVYAGSTGTKTINIAGKRDCVAWSEASQPEAYGTAVISPLSQISNEVQLGDDGQPVVGGVGLGINGVLHAKEIKLYMHAYTFNPDGLTGDGRIVELPVRRGATGPLSIRYIDGFVYGIDVFGIWRMAPGGLPEPIDTDIANDVRAMQWNFNYGDDWHIGYHPCDKTVHFFVTTGSDTLPRTSYVWSIEHERWMGTVLWPTGISITTTQADQFGIYRMNLFTRHTGAAGAYQFAYGIGTTFGAHPTNNAPLTGTATTGTTTSIDASGATWSTTDGGLIGCSVIRERAGVQEERIITANTATQVAVHTAFSDATLPGDRYKLAPIKSIWRSPRIALGYPERKMRNVELWLWMRNQSASTTPKVRFYYDGNYTAMTDVAYSLTEDGTSWTAGSGIFQVDPTTSGMHFFRIPLGDWKYDVQVEVYSDDPGEPWSILGARFIGEMDDSWNPARK